MDLKFIIRKRQTIIVISLIFLLLATIFTLLQPVSYSARSKVMVVQKFDKEVDSYAVARSKAYISEILAEVVKTYTVYNQVAQADLGVDRGYFEKKPQIDNVLKKWQSTVSASSLGDSGIIEIVVKHPNSKQAENISNGILEVLSAKHSRYHNGEDIKLTIIDPPLIGLASPDIKFNLIVAFVLGLSAAFVYIVIFPEPEHNLNIFKKKKNNLLEIKTLKSLDR